MITKIPLDPKIQLLIDKGQPIFESEIKSPVIDKYHDIEKCK